MNHNDSSRGRPSEGGAPAAAAAAAAPGGGGDGNGNDDDRGDDASSRSDWMKEFLSGLRLVGSMERQNPEIQQLQQQLTQNEREMKRKNLDIELCQKAMVEREKRQRISEKRQQKRLERGMTQYTYRPPPKLRLTPEELEWAWDIKAAYNHKKNSSGGTTGTTNCNSEWQIQKITDYEIGQYSVILKEDTEKAIQSILAIRQFKMKYWITDTVEQGIKAIEDFIRLAPGFLVSVGVVNSPPTAGESTATNATAASDGGGDSSLVSSSSSSSASSSSSVMLAFDYCKFFSSVFRSSEDNMRIYWLFNYYMTQVVAPNYDVLRGGVSFLMECNGFTIQNMDQRLEQQGFEELFQHTAIQHKELRFYNTSPLLNGFVELLKPFIPAPMREVWHVGCKIEAVDPFASGDSNNFLNSIWPGIGHPLATLPSLLLVPDYPTAMQNLIPKIRNLLEERYRNERSFQLTPLEES